MHPVSNDIKQCPWHEGMRTSMPSRKKAMAQAMGTVSQPTWPAVQKGRMVSQHSRKREVCLQQQQQTRKRHVSMSHQHSMSEQQGMGSHQGVCGSMYA
jgi:hypothetical protein